jgi:hypothetical protein
MNREFSRVLLITSKAQSKIEEPKAFQEKALGQV